MSQSRDDLRTFKPYRLAKGTPSRNRVAISIGFSPELFRHIKELAVLNDRSFAAQVRRLIIAGIKAKGEQNDDSS